MFVYVLDIDRIHVYAIYRYKCIGISGYIMDFLLMLRTVLLLRGMPC